MKLSNKNIAIIALACALPATYLSLPVAAGASKNLTPAVAVSPVQDQDPRKCAEDRDHDPEKCIEARDAGQNGITVGEPKVYDDALLQQMLRAAEARLAALQVFDQAAILARLGAVTGASQQTSSFGLNIQGPSVPGVTTATTLPTQTTTQTTAAGATSSGLTTVSGLGTENVTTTRPAFAPPTATAPPPTTTFPSGFSVSSSDILNEQTQLAAEINGLRLLLAGSLSDHYINSPQLGSELTKFKTTLGFPIAVSPSKRYKNAVAIVEVEVKSHKGLSRELPAVTAIIPREKTYNVAAITDKSTSIGGGVATQIIGFSGSWVRGHKTYYLVQDQDTVALTYRPADGLKTGFRWQFRPVLGQSYVKSGLKQTFVQLAFPVLRDSGSREIGAVTVRTYWRKYDRKTGTVGELIGGSYREMYRSADIPRFKLAIAPGFFNAADHLEDLGGGQILVKVEGRFLPGTSVRIGSSLLAEGARFKHEHQGIRFVASVSDLATKKVALVAHDGTEVPLRFTTENCSGGLRIEQPQITTVDEANSRVRVRVRPKEMAMQDALRLIFVLGTRVYGYSDAPLRREVLVERDSAGRPLEVDSKGQPVESVYLSAVVPNSVLIANPELKVQTLLTPEGCSASTSLAAYQPVNQNERLFLLEQGTKIRFLLYGTRLSSLDVLSPTPFEWEAIGDSSNVDTLRVLSLSPAQVANNKHVVLQRRNEQPFLLAIPELAPKQPVLPSAKDSLTLNDDEAVIVGDNLSDVASVTYKDQDVTIKLDGKNLRLSGLRALGATASAEKKTFVLKFKSPDVKPREVEFEVFNEKQKISIQKS